MEENKCPWCSRQMHLDVIKTVHEHEDSALVPGKYHVLHCGSCRRSFHVLQPERQKEVQPI